MFGQVSATLTSSRKIAPLKAEIVFRQGQNAFRLFIGVDARSGDLLIEQDGTSDTRQESTEIQWGCGNLNVQAFGSYSSGTKVDKSLMPMSPVTSRTFQLSWPLESWQLGSTTREFFKENKADFSSVG